jgi:hypothetical protein
VAFAAANLLQRKVAQPDAALWGNVGRSGRAMTEREIEIRETGTGYLNSRMTHFTLNGESVPDTNKREGHAAIAMTPVLSAPK